MSDRAVDGSADDCSRNLSLLTVALVSSGSRCTKLNCMSTLASVSAKSVHILYCFALTPQAYTQQFLCI